VTDADPDMAPDDGSEPLTHFFHCWRFASHHRCAVALIERQAQESDGLLVKADRLEREIRERMEDLRRVLPGLEALRDGGAMPPRTRAAYDRLSAAAGTGTRLEAWR
jgi:hypothetical protein